MAALKCRSAFFPFSEANREEVKAAILRVKGADSKVSVADVAKELGHRWKALSDTGGQTCWQERAAALKAEAVARSLEGGAGATEGAAVGTGPDPDTNTSGLPLSIVKKVILLDPEAQRISQEALLIVSHAAELFLAHLTTKCAEAVAQARPKRKTLRLDDFAASLRTDRRLVAAGLRDVTAMVSARGAAALTSPTGPARASRRTSVGPLDPDEEAHGAGADVSDADGTAHVSIKAGVEPASGAGQGEVTDLAEAGSQGGSDPTNADAALEQAGGRGSQGEVVRAKRASSIMDEEGLAQGPDATGEGSRAGGAASKKARKGNGGSRSSATAPAGAPITSFFTRVAS